MVSCDKWLTLYKKIFLLSIERITPVSFLLSLRRKKIVRENGTNAERPAPGVYTPMEYAFF